ncbi:hypothetical protein [Tardisphaera saccharovorans]
MRQATSSSWTGLLFPQRTPPWVLLVNALGLGSSAAKAPSAFRKHLEIPMSLLVWPFVIYPTDGISGNEDENPVEFQVTEFLKHFDNKLFIGGRTK